MSDGKNEHGFNVKYFKKKISTIQRDLSSYKPEEFLQVLENLKNGLDKNHTTCTWELGEPDHNAFKGTCGVLFCLEDGTPPEHNINY